MVAEPHSLGSESDYTARPIQRGRRGAMHHDVQEMITGSWTQERKEKRIKHPASE